MIGSILGFLWAATKLLVKVVLIVLAVSAVAAAAFLVWVWVAGTSKPERQ